MAEAEPKATRSRYRKVEVRTWGDEKFRELSPMPPSGQGLWLFLICGPHTGPIPGLFRAGRAAMAEELGWEMEAFDKAFGEVLQQGMAKADFRARVVWVPKAIKHNRPESPNVVRSWASEFDLIPECSLKWEALAALRDCIYGLGESFAKAFDEAFGKASGKPSPKAMPNQEQEQEQEQEELLPPNPPQAGGKSRKRPKSDRVAFATFIRTCREKGEKPITADDPIFRFADDAMIPREFIALAWRAFSAKHRTGKKQQAGVVGWRAHFRDAVKGNWAKVWYFPNEGAEAALTTVGIALKREMEADAARKAAEHDGSEAAA